MTSDRKKLWCSVLGCLNKSVTHPELSFFEIPSNNPERVSQKSSTEPLTVREVNITVIETETNIINYDPSNIGPVQDVPAKKKHNQSDTKPKCFRCNTIFQQISGLIKEMYDIQRTVPPIECPYCKAKKGKCPRCYKAVKKFLAAKVKEHHVREARYTTWLQKVKQLLLAISESEITHNPRKLEDISPDDELEYLLKQLQSPLSKMPTRRPRIGQFPSEDFLRSSSDNIKKNQKFIKGLLTEIKNRRKENATHEAQDVRSALDSIKPNFKVLAQRAPSDKGVAGSQTHLLSISSGDTFDSSDWVGKGYAYRDKGGYDYASSEKQKVVETSMKGDALDTSSISEPISGSKSVSPTEYSSESKIKKSGDEAVKRFFSSTTTGLFKRLHYGGLKNFAVDEYSKLAPKYSLSPTNLNKLDLLQERHALEKAYKQPEGQNTDDGDRMGETQQKHVKGDFYISDIKEPSTRNINKGLDGKDSVQEKDIKQKRSTDSIEETRRGTGRDRKGLSDRSITSKEKIHDKPDLKSRKSIIVDPKDYSRKGRVLEHVILFEPKSKKRTKEDYIEMVRETRKYEDLKSDPAHGKQVHVHKSQPTVKKDTMINTKDTIVLTKKPSQTFKQKPVAEAKISILKHRGQHADSVKVSEKIKKNGEENADVIPSFLADLDFLGSTTSLEKTFKLKSEHAMKGHREGIVEKTTIQKSKEHEPIRKEPEQKLAGQSEEKPKKIIVVKPLIAAKQKSPKPRTKSATAKPLPPKRIQYKSKQSLVHQKQSKSVEKISKSKLKDALHPPTPQDIIPLPAPDDFKNKTKVEENYTQVSEKTSLEKIDKKISDTFEQSKFEIKKTETVMPAPVLSKPNHEKLHNLIEKEQRRMKLVPTAIPEKEKKIDTNIGEGRSKEGKKKKGKENKAANEEEDKINKQIAHDDALTQKLMLQLLKEKGLEKKSKLKEEQKRLKAQKEIKTPIIPDLPELKPKRTPKRVKDDDVVVECQRSVEIVREMITGDEICPYNSKLFQEVCTHKEPDMFFIKHKFNSIKMIPISTTAQSSKKSISKRTPDTTEGKGILRYELSNKEFVNKGITKLPVIKVMRMLNIYNMMPTKPERNWYARHKSHTCMYYETGEKLAEIVDKHGHFRWYYKNGNLALDFFKSKDLNARNRYVIYSSGNNDASGNARPVTVLASFDQLGNGVVYDHCGNYRLKYNQTEGTIMDSKIDPVGKWKWHNLNDHAVLQPKFVENYISHEKRGSKLLNLIRSEEEEEPIFNPIAIANEIANEEMLAIEAEHVAKEKSTKQAQKYKPFEIKSKSVKINDEFALKIVSQSKIYLTFRDWPVSFKLNLGLVIMNHEIIASMKSDLNEVFTPYDRKIPKSESVTSIRNILDNTKKHYRKRSRIIPKSVSLHSAA